MATSSNCYIFPLSSQKYNTDSSYYPNMTENFDVQDYLTTNSLRIAYTLGTTTAQRWWFRSSHDTT